MRQTAESLGLVAFVVALDCVPPPLGGACDLARAVVALATCPRQFGQHVPVDFNRLFRRVARCDQRFVGKVNNVAKFNGGAC